mmetsp:Transcript_51039/g.153421  ORF Transcript_51039/g.153421 Transcript_51039/m.153421 type:complete len:84 (-) Transcript_51039:49-300(-)
MLVERTYQPEDNLFLCDNGTASNDDILPCHQAPRGKVVIKSKCPKAKAMKMVLRPKEKDLADLASFDRDAGAQKVEALNPLPK